MCKSMSHLRKVLGLGKCTKGFSEGSTSGGSQGLTTSTLNNRAVDRELICLRHIEHIYTPQTIENIKTTILNNNVDFFGGLRIKLS